MKNYPNDNIYFNSDGVIKNSSNNKVLYVNNPVISLTTGSNAFYAYDYGHDTFLWTINGSIDGNKTTKGFYLSTSNPPITDRYSTTGSVGSFSSNIGSLTDTTTYYYRTYSYDNDITDGLIYGSVSNFTTPAKYANCASGAGTTYSDRKGFVAYMYNQSRTYIAIYFSTSNTGGHPMLGDDYVQASGTIGSHALDVYFGYGFGKMAKSTKYYYKAIAMDTGSTNVVYEGTVHSFTTPA